MVTSFPPSLGWSQERGAPELTGVMTTVRLSVIIILIKFNPFIVAYLLLPVLTSASALSQYMPPPLPEVDCVGYFP